MIVLLLQHTELPLPYNLLKQRCLQHEVYESGRWIRRADASRNAIRSYEFRGRIHVFLLPRTINFDAETGENTPLYGNFTSENQ